MTKTTELVINASPTVALVAALGDLRVLQLYQKVWVPLEVCNEIMAGGAAQFAVPEFAAAHWLQKIETPLVLSPLLANSLDAGEAAVIQLALDKQVATVCIDEHAGRRMARLHGLAITGSIGVLLRAKAEGFPLSMHTAIQQMQARGIWLGDSVVRFALAQAGEQ
jgi:predicted nucleic acid-binding protein